ncbi:MAG: serine/threonine protein kinase [Chloroflexota bacterium]|nr:serine/threonine protein kinase [Chloroflexota bacterium]
MSDTEDAAIRPPLEPGVELLPDYTVAAHLSRSHFLDIYEVWSGERACYCVAKILRPDWRDNPEQRRDLLREGRLLKRLTHMHLVRAYAVHTQPDPVVILESVVGPTLARYLAGRTRRVPVGAALSIGIGLATAICYLHRNGVLHLDLTPSNVIMRGPVATLIDLSAARPPGRGPSRWGTDEYMAPEQVRGGSFSAAADAWGLGAVLFEVAVGRQAFPFDTATGCHAQLARRAPPLRASRRVPAAFAAIVDRCLDPDPARRPEIAAIIAALQGLDAPQPSLLSP